MLKLIALITMLVDHIGAGFFENEIIYRLIGRLAFPLFAYHVARGIRLTADIGQYKQRLLITAIVSQLPYSIYTGLPYLNVVFLFYITVVLIDEINNKSYWGISAAAAIILLSHKYIEYGLYGILIISIFYCYDIKLKDINIKINKNIFYYFYPAHFVILKLIKIYL